MSVPKIGKRGEPCACCIPSNAALLAGVRSLTTVMLKNTALLASVRSTLCQLQPCNWWRHEFSELGGKWLNIVRDHVYIMPANAAELTLPRLGVLGSKPSPVAASKRRRYNYDARDLT